MWNIRHSLLLVWPHLAPVEVSVYFSRAAPCGVCYSNPNENSQVMSDCEQSLPVLSQNKGEWNANGSHVLIWLCPSLGSLFASKKGSSILLSLINKLTKSQDQMPSPELLGSPQISNKFVKKLQFFTRQKEESVQYMRVNYIYWI